MYSNSLNYSKTSTPAGTPTIGIALHTELFPSLLSAEEAFSSIVDSLIQEHFSGGKPPDPQVVLVLLGDQCSKHCSSVKEFKDQTLALWRNIYKHRFALIGSLVPPALDARRRPYMPDNINSKMTLKLAVARVLRKCKSNIS